MATKSIEVSKGPSYSISKLVLEYCEKWQDQSFVPGEKFPFPGLETADGFTFVEAVAQEMPEYDNRDEDVYEDKDLQLRITVHADSAMHKVETAKGSETLLKKLSKWLIGDSEDYMKVLNHEILESTEQYHKICVVLIVDSYVVSHVIGEVSDSPFYDVVWNPVMNSLIQEGVCYAHGKVPVALRDGLRKQIDNLAKNTPIDFHPNSKDIVRDLVHPALYTYVKGVSKLTSKTPKEVSSEEKFDFWGRPYEDSKYQWLPTPFSISDDGKCSIAEYINNLNREKFSGLYTELESLFNIFLPYFEEVWSYAKTMKFFKDPEENEEQSTEPPFVKEPVSFKGKELQVIVKIVEYKLQPGQSYEGVWHAEGMSHENIVMTGIYFLDRDMDITGGDLRYKRAFTVYERNQIFWNVAQERPSVVNTFASEGFVPLGRFPTEEGFMLVFPNCHIHKIAKMVNTAANKAASRRIVVFFVVNPEKKIISTREVPKQQDVISLTEAKRYRLESMAERKYDKEKLNVRDIELCEH
ncbi:uncharacterized protein LOC130656823 isoform X2 [Hydractinia symbiolongicarpus]|nr:uncharacterized protein LOC130656823 isoform X2 [Hydractinia symbiolongicarpus]